MCVTVIDMVCTDLSSSVLEGPASKPVLSTPPLAKIPATVSPVRRVVFLGEEVAINRHFGIRLLFSESMLGHLNS